MRVSCRSFSRRASQSRNWTWASCIAGEFFINWATKEALCWSSTCVHAQSLQSYPTLCNPMDYNLPRYSVHGNSLGKNTGVGCHILLQGIFLTQGSNPCLLCLLHWQTGSLLLASPGSPYCSSPVANQWQESSGHIVHSGQYLVDRWTINWRNKQRILANLVFLFLANSVISIEPIPQ